MGVRFSTVEAQKAVERAISAHTVVGPLDSPPHYSVLVAGSNANGDPSRGFHFLYRGAAVVVRTPDPRRLVKALLSHLSAHDPEPSAGLLKVNGTALVRDGSALVGPADLRWRLDVLERRLQSKGFRVVDTPVVLIDPERGELVVPPPHLRIDEPGLDCVGDGFPPPRRADTPVRAGRYPISGWAFAVVPERAGPLSRAVATALAAQWVTNISELGVQHVLSALATVIRRVRPTGIATPKPPEIVAALAAA